MSIKRFGLIIDPTGLCDCHIKEDDNGEYINIKDMKLFICTNCKNNPCYFFFEKFVNYSIMEQSYSCPIFRDNRANFKVIKK